MWWREVDSESTAIRPKSLKCNSASSKSSSSTRKSTRESEITGLQREFEKLEKLAQECKRAQSAELVEARQANCDAKKLAEQLRQEADAIRCELSDLNGRFDIESKGRLQALAELEKTATLFSREIDNLRSQLRAQERSAAKEAARRSFFLRGKTSKRPPAKAGGF